MKEDKKPSAASGLLGCGCLLFLLSIGALLLLLLVGALAG